MKKFILKIIFLSFAFLLTGLVINIVTIKYVKGNYFLLENNIKPETNTLIIGSSRTHHNFSLEMLPDSIAVFSKPNLYAVDIYNVLSNFDFSNIDYLYIELQESNISTNFNQRIFWDPKNSLKILKTNYNNFSSIFINTFALNRPKSYLKLKNKINQLPNLLDNYNIVLYPTMFSASRPLLTEIVAYNKDSLNYKTNNSHLSHRYINIDMQRLIIKSVPKKIDVCFFIPYGSYTSFNFAKQNNLDINLLELRNFELDSSDIYDVRHLNFNGASKMTKHFLNKIKP